MKNKETSFLREKIKVGPVQHLGERNNLIRVSSGIAIMFSVFIKFEKRKGWNSTIISYVILMTTNKNP